MIRKILTEGRDALIQEWFAELPRSVQRSDLISDDELRRQAAEFLSLSAEAAQSGTLDINSSAWTPVRDFLESLSKERAELGFSPLEVATFIFSFKKPILSRLHAESTGTENLAEETWRATALLDSLGLLTTGVYHRGREAIIARQQEEMLELSTPVVKLWEGILALPLIGTLDSARTQTVMEALLQRIVETGAEVAIIDITGVPTVDTLVAQQLMKTVSAARLMGVKCVISGIRPQIAQTIVHLGVDLGDVVTKASLADGLGHALYMRGIRIVQHSTTA